MKKGRLKRGLALFLSTVTLSMSVIPHLPPDILTAYAFRMHFNTSTSGDGHYDISGSVDNQGIETDFLCMKKGASAKSEYDYYKTDNDVSYADGTIEHKRLFWAYMLTYGNTTGIHEQFNDHSIEGYFKTPLAGSTKVAKEVAWSHGKTNGGNALIDEMATDGFMQLENIPAGCKSPQEIFNSVSKYGTPETAISMNSLKDGPGSFSSEKLYAMAGLQDWATFRKYCTVEGLPVKVSGPAGDREYPVKIEFDDYAFGWSIIDPDNGYPVASLERENAVVFRIKYNPDIFKVLNVTGLIEYFETDDAYNKESQPFYRAFGKVQVTYPEFYMTTAWKPGPDIPPSGSDGDPLGDGDTITVKIYEHQETFESHYKVDLTKYDYETGHPLKNSIWQVLEAFPDKDQIGTDDETDGKLVESKMREDPTTWDNWLIFEEDMETDENGYISHDDERFYDFAHKYCDGHPIPPEPESSGDAEADEEAADEYAQLMEEWQAAVDECAQAAADSNGTFHHWECGSETEPSEAEAFEGSGCKAARDQAYENFINLRYSYTFREVDPRYGYIIHGPNGHPDDVPIEIVTIASSEAEKEAEWTECSNADIIVEGKADSSLGGGNKDEEGGEEGETENARVFMGSRRKKSSDSNTKSRLYLTEKYELSWGEQIVNALRNFVGLPDKFIEENKFEINIVAEYDEVEEATPSDAEYVDEEFLIDDVVNSTTEETKPVEEIESQAEETKPEKVEPTVPETEEPTAPTPAETKPVEETKPEKEESTAPTPAETKPEESKPEKVEPTAAETEAETEAKAETESNKEQVKEEVTEESKEISISVSPRKVPLVSAKKPEEAIPEETIAEENKPEREEPTAAETEAETEATKPEKPEESKPEKAEPTVAETKAPVAEESEPGKPEIETSKPDNVLEDETIADEDIIAEDDIIIDEDRLLDEDEATPSNTDRPQRTSYDYEREGVTFTLEKTDPGKFYEAAGGYIDLDGAIVDSQPEVDKGPADNIGHSFKVYDHRVPGQIHFNKKDMQLAAGENPDYDAYGDTQGDSTLEGAVYGLFAADDIYGPDTQRDDSGNVIKGTGIIFDANDLVAVATTDKNGDGSFLTITEKPHSIYNYKEGKIEYTGKEYPKNLYDADTYRKEYDEEETGRIYKDNVTTNGDYWIGRPLILGNYYIKELTRSEGFELSITGKDMEVTNPTDDNRNDYGDTDDAKTHPEGSAWIKEKMKHVVTFPEGNAAYGNRENLFDIMVGSNNATKGFNVVIDGLPEGADFYFDDVKTQDVIIQVPVGGTWEDAKEEPLYLTAEDSTTPKRDIDGNPIKNPNATLIPSAYSGVGFEAKKATGTTANPSDTGKYNAAYVDKEENFRYVKYELEQMMRSMGIDTPKDSATGSYSQINFPVYDEATGGNSYGMPEVTINVSNVSTNASVINAILDYYLANRIYTYGGLQNIQMTGNTARVTIVVGMSPKKTTLYELDDAGNAVAGYLFKLNEKTKRYVLRKYTGDQVQVVAIPGAKGKAKVVFAPDFRINENGMPEDLMTTMPGDEYLCYAPGDTLYDYWYQDGNGNWVGHEPSRRKVYVPKFEDQKVEQSTTNTSKVPVVPSMESVKDPVGSTYVVYDPISKQYTLHAGAKDADLGGVKSSHFTIAIDDGRTQLTQADIDKIGENNVWGYEVGKTISNSAYIMRVSGAGASVHTSEDFNQDESYIKNQRLVYSGMFDLIEDGNTNNSPNPVQERIIAQKIKVTKNIDEKSYNNTNSYTEVHEDWFTETFGGLFGNNSQAKKMDNFRFKVYLKSNLERLYRDNDGNVLWQDRLGNEIDVLDRNKKFPALVNKIYTKVTHVTNPLYKDSEDAIVSNDALYSYTDGYINENQNNGYTSILETIEVKMEDNASTRMVKAYNYDKFFDAVAVANNDKWDDANPTYTSWQPIGNTANRTDKTIENAKVSDKVRQFAIDWYLDDEIAKLIKKVPNNPAENEDKDGSVPYSDEMYDEALRNAIIKAENYLKPFFSYDMDEIYSIEWDSEENGGKDKDTTTLSANTLYGDAANDSEGYYFANSQYLPYGTYVVVEQQPRYDHLEDFKNKHYQIDKPREVILPSVYENHDGAQASPEVTNPYYNYDANITQPDMEKKYKIRFNEEALHLIKGRNAEGDFEVYKYGMDIDNIDNGVTGAAAGDYFALTQSEFKPYKNYYNEQDDRTTGNVPYYLTEGLSGRTGVSKYYRYSSVAENAGTANEVQYTGGTKTEDNGQGFFYKDNVKTMQGEQIAYDGKYAPMLVPWTVVAPNDTADEEADAVVQANGESTYKGYDYTKFRNRFFTTKLRLEKLDSETHENILHDGAIFNIYAAKRNDAKDGNGEVMFYEEDTLISGTKEFLESMCATDIKPIARRFSFIDRLTGKEYGPGNLYTGTVPAGTPICEEPEKIILGDSEGNQTVAFKSYSTVLDGKMKDEETNTNLVYQNQTVGYIETPQPLGAGVYVICEAKAPSGYTRSKPIAVEVYSDKVTYYKQANKDERVLAAMYEYPSDNPTTNGNKPQDIVNVARVNVENAPIKLTVEKVKESSQGTANTTPDKTVKYKVSGRVDGTLAEIGNNPDLEYAYNEAGEYLGYAWKKGTLEYLVERKNAGENVEIAYEGKVFAGYGFVTKTLETADDANGYVAGATMTLFDALEIKLSGDTQDHAYEGLVIERTADNNISRMYVKQGYAGNKVEFVKEKDEDGKEYVLEYPAGVDKNQNPIKAEGNIWTAETIERPDTDILYYDLDSLEVISVDNVDGKKIKYGYNKDHDKVSIDVLESDKKNHPKTDTEYSVYAFKGGIPYLEFVGGDFNEISYSAINKTITVGKGTVVYHLDRDGNRDAKVDPYTGMAYVTEEKPDGSERVLVWAVNIHRDEFGNIIARDKITTSRIATLGENVDGYHEDEIVDVTNNSGHDIPNEEKPYYEHSESGYITGTWDSAAGEESHKESTVNKNENGQNMNDDVLVDDNNGTFNKELNPTYDEHGLVNYYQRSDETYDKGTELYDRNGDFVRYQDSDNLEEYNNAAYRINDHDELFDGDETKEHQTQKNLWHRQGENYILENTWVTSDKTPNDPFDTTPMDGQPDVLKRVPVGHYIMEELKVPKGYLKGMPTGITVNETDVMHHASMIDKTTKVEISKIDGTDKQTFDIINMETGLKEGTTVEGKNGYGYGQVADAIIALYKAKKVYTADFITYPKGYYLVRENPNGDPITYYATDSMVSSIKELTAKWTTEAAPIYLEGVPEGYYLLEELETPDGFATAEPLEVYISNTAEVQTVIMKDDHTKVEVAKHEMTDKGKELLNGAGFTLYKGNADGTYNPADVVDTWMSDDMTDYTDVINLKDYPNTSGEDKESGFRSEFEAMYKEYGTTEGTAIRWSVERTAKRSSTDDNAWVLEDRKLVTVANNVVTFPAGMSEEDKQGFLAAYNANKKNENIIKWANEKSATYVSHTQIDGSIVDGKPSATKFPTTATMLFETNDGKQIEITAYQESADRTGTTYQFDYKFDYKKLPSINKYANAYTTIDGHRRFDYLPINSTYVLVETTVPDGYAKAENIVITVKDMVDVQYYSVINETTAIRISKVSEGKEDELVGAKLALYKAADDGTFVQDEAHLITTWVSGNDGTYTDTDFVNGLIPDGYEKGDLKPHTIHGLKDGTYYLAELSTPPYYTTFEPVKIEYTGSEEIKFVRVSDKPVLGELIIRKTDMNDAPLKGVTFELKAYNKAGDVVLEKHVSDTNGIVTVRDLPVGEVTQDGTIVPYTYKLREVNPPNGFAASAVIKSFQFDPDKGGVSYQYGEFATENVTVKNEKTKIYIEKRDFTHLEDDGIEGAFIEGAVLAVYEVEGKDAEDNYIYDETKALDTWTTSKDEPRHMIEGLVAGKSYLLKELKAPEGYNLMKPIVFTISENGRSIQSVTNKLNTITVNYITPESQYLDTDNLDIDSIESVTLTGRYVSKVEMVVTDKSGQEVASWTSDGNPHTILNTDGLTGGEVYTFTEYTCYSDGSRTATEKTTKRVNFNESGEYVVDSRQVGSTNLTLYWADGTEIEHFTPNSFVNYKTIKNNVNPENPKVTIKNRNGVNGDVLDPKQVVINTIAYVNTANIKTDITVKAKVNNALILNAEDGGTVSGDTITWVVKDVAPSTSGYVTFDTQVDDRSQETISVDAEISFNTKTFSTSKFAPIMQPNKLTVYNELTGSGKEMYAGETSNFRIRLYSELGAELKGIYQYTGSRTGEMRSGDIITLAGNEYIVINPGNIYKNVKYKVERIPDETQKVFTERNTEGVAAEDTGAFAVFTRNVKDTSERELFVKGGKYLLIETTNFTDGESRESNKIQFTLNENASIDSIGGYDKETHVSLSKTDITTGEELPGAHIVIKDKNGKVIDEWTSTTEPHIITGKLTPGEEYTMIEEGAPDGYGYAEEIKFTVNEDGTVDKVVMEDKKTHVVFHKTDITTGEELPGAHIVIKDKDGKVVEEWISTTEPHEIVGKLIAGEEYTMIEVGPPDGYAYSAEIKFTVSKDGTIDKVVMEDKPTHVTITKTDITTGEELPGAHIVIKDKDGNIVDEWISTDKPHEIVGELIAGEEYTMIEEGAPDGYGYAEEIKFTVSKDGTIDKVVMEDKPTHVTISKTDITTDKELPGAHIVIKDKNNQVVDEWISTDKPHEIVGKLIAGETYTMIEVGPPDGYAYSVEVEFTVSRDGSIDKVVMQDKPTHVTITKTDITTGEELPGAHIVIKDKDGNIVDEWISTDKPHEIVGELIAGEEYTMIEEGAPDGYGYAEDIKFTVNKDGSITTVVMEDKPTKVVISKVDITTDKELPGAHLQIKDKAGNVIEEWVSTDKPHEITGKLIAGQEYTLIETTAPNGYLVAESITFTVNRDGSVNTVVMKDERKPSGGGSGGGGGGGSRPSKPSKYPIELIKRNVNNEFVPGAEYGVYTEGGHLVTSGTTGSDGKLTLYLSAGSYYVQEISSPSGYSLNPMKYPIKVSSKGLEEGGSGNAVNMVDDFAVVAISKLDIATLEPLEGAVFTMYTMDGTPVATATSGPEGYAEFRQVLHGDYYIMETGAPEGYILSPEKRYVSITKFYTNAAPIIWYNNPDISKLRPRTGDDSPIIPVTVLLLFAVSGFCVYSYKTKKKKREEE